MSQPPSEEEPSANTDIRTSGHQGSGHQRWSVTCQDSEPLNDSFAFNLVLKGTWLWEVLLVSNFVLVTSRIFSSYLHLTRWSWADPEDNHATCLLETNKQTHCLMNINKQRRIIRSVSKSSQLVWLEIITLLSTCWENCKYCTREIMPILCPTPWYVRYRDTTWPRTGGKEHSAVAFLWSYTFKNIYLKLFPRKPDCQQKGWPKFELHLYTRKVSQCTKCTQTVEQ